MLGTDDVVGSAALKLWDEIIKNNTRIYGDGKLEPLHYEMLIHKDGVPIIVRRYRTKEAANEVAKEAIRHGWKVEGRKI